MGDPAGGGAPTQSRLDAIKLLRRYPEASSVASAHFGASGQLHVKSVEEFNALRSKFEGMAIAAKNARGNVAYSWGQDLLDPLTLNIAELWTSYDAWSAHNSLPEVGSWYQELARQGGLLDGGMSNVILFNVSGAASLCVREPYKGC